ncbi:MAG: DegT/DnrJ/EryC1/StrS family aminotransferase [Deltaproteobacteria bacterium]|nr:DegT/DnrJ/EryC1/StrS family aminotransferase [Deltaproteobacteria bacterium]MCB9479645.1 DegT/DnrJ/EryC1/StrS family aminotransferase [Deltaproteobacteria bacterium]MCB9489858.1 DegT/DnrJ/EryC1/StrS family aminotransferase [Deltaproteobacteria bacterium]
MHRLPPVATMTPVSAALAPLGSRGGEREILERETADRLSGDRALAFNSGRAALTWLLTVLAGQRTGGGVIVPAYTCYSVPSAIVRSGLRIYPMDIDPATLDFAPKDLDGHWPTDVFAVVSPGLFGLPADLTTLEAACRDKHVFLIDDAAQTWGATVDGRAAGSFGDAGLASFGRGKPLGGVGGGVLVTRGQALGDAVEGSRPVDTKLNSLKVAFKSVAGALAVRRWLFPMVQALPFVTMGVNEFKPEFAVGGLSAARSALILRLFSMQDALIAKRVRMGELVREALSDIPGLILPAPRENMTATYLRFPVVFEDPADRDAALMRLSAKGLGATRMYPKPVHLIDGASEFVYGDLGPFPGAEKVAKGILTLPTHAGVRERDVAKFAEVIRRVTKAGGDRGWG